MTHERFIELLTREFTGELPDNEREELNGLLEAQPEYRKERELLLAFWQKEKDEYATSQALFSRVLEKIRLKEMVEMEPMVRRRRRGWWIAAAAVVVGVVSLVLFHGGRGGEKPVAPVAVHWLRRATRPRQTDVVKLADGTVVRLNSGTTLLYPDKFLDSNRLVWLEGEAFFDVRKDAARPFIIHSDRMNIRVLGTSFNVKSYKNEAVGEATLITGSIEVTLTDRPADRITLKPREKLIIQNNLITKRPADTGVPTPDAGKNTRYSLANLTYYHDPARTIIETSWLENKLAFSGKDFSDLSVELERWYGVHIEFRSDPAKHYNFTGMITKETLREALDALKMIEPFRYEIVDSTVYIY